MSTQDTSELKNKIINFLKLKGPSLPVHIAKEIGLSTLFASAFLSELLSERKLKMSNMKIGSSKLHFLEGQEDKLESFGQQYLKSKEQDAFLLLKEKNFLKDEDQHPAIRVALREIKDFAVSFNNGEKIIWRYYLVLESDFNFSVEVKEEVIKDQVKEISEEVEETKEKFEEEPIREKVIIEEIKEKPLEKDVEDSSNENNLDIFDGEVKKELEKPKKKVAKKKSSSKKKNEQFFNRVKEHLSSKSIEIIGIEGFSKVDLSLRVRKNDKIYLLVAYNKKRIIENDIINANKKAVELNLSYFVLSLGEPLKKMSSFIGAIRNLSNIEKIE